jgi:predicted enzyme related to lactoylglutathione lyase
MSETARRVESPEVERHPGKFVWFELVTPDPRRAQSFYAAVLGWKVQPFPVGGQTYDMVYAGDTMIAGYTPPRTPAEPARWVSCISVDDVDRTVADAVAAGGRLVGTVVETPGVGRVARIVDPQGVELSLFRNAMGDPPDVVQVPEGLWLWNELHVPDPDAAVDFYGRILGYQHRVFGPGGDEPYVILSRDGVDRGGVTSAGCREAPPHWLPYVHVQDVDRAVARARNAGAQVRMVEDIPGVGRIAVIVDPAGAVLAFLSPLPRIKSG